MVFPAVRLLVIGGGGVMLLALVGLAVALLVTRGRRDREE
jgi:hypothetical protein